MSDAVTYETNGHVATITMNKPDRMNRLDAEIVDALHQSWKRFMATAGERVAVVAGNGRAFSAGADLNAIPHDLYRAIPGIGVSVDKPVVAAVQGWCVGGGMVLTTMCDLMVAADDAMFSYPEVKIGFSGGLISNLASRIPHKIAMELTASLMFRLLFHDGPDRPGVNSQGALTRGPNDNRVNVQFPQARP